MTMDPQFDKLHLDDSITDYLDEAPKEDSRHGVSRSRENKISSDDHLHVENAKIKDICDENVNSAATHEKSTQAVQARAPQKKDETLAEKRPSQTKSVGVIQTAPVAIDVVPAAQKRSIHERELSVLIRQQGRAFSQALMTIAGTRQRSGRLWLIFGATLVVIVMLIIQVYYRHRDLNLGYELSEAISAREALLEENRKLRIELRVLSRRERLEPYATQQLGMATIRPDQIVIIHEKKAEKSDENMRIRRLDGLDNVKRIDN